MPLCCVEVACLAIDNTRNAVISTNACGTKEWTRIVLCVTAFQHSWLHNRSQSTHSHHTDETINEKKTQSIATRII